ncbi:hypothetical protein K469DRAFT_13676 [Zopfia rhizophila CBS 207.26]|uniref:Uncharacterized protein n=1 Tax=Zopfia rhizophila CBS 207.26 TaxID=1314779 RepID=A0A6A6ETN6_9PEZI|nr:hypothetical protein K469DRAFT_13676 [Zopfia rhizophila CBS 207.26]
MSRGEPVDIPTAVRKCKGSKTLVSAADADARATGKSSEGGSVGAWVVCLTGMLSVVKVDALARQLANAFEHVICPGWKRHVEEHDTQPGRCRLEVAIFWQKNWQIRTVAAGGGPKVLHPRDGYRRQSQQQSAERRERVWSKILEESAPPCVMASVAPLGNRVPNHWRIYRTQRPGGRPKMGAWGVQGRWHLVIPFDALTQTLIPVCDTLHNTSCSRQGIAIAMAPD